MHTFLMNVGRRRRVVFVLTGAREGRAQGGGADCREAAGRVRRRGRRNTMVAVRDGVRLAADVYRPARDGKPAEGRFPTLLTRTPYDKNGAAGEAAYYAARGYIVVANDVRGPVRQRGDLAADRRRPARTATTSSSGSPRSPGPTARSAPSARAIPGGTQHALAEMNPPHLTTMVPIDALSNCGVSGMRHGGAFELRFMNWIFQTGAPNSRAALADPALQAALDRERPADPRARRQPAGPARARRP